MGGKPKKKDIIAYLKSKDGEKFKNIAVKFGEGTRKVLTAAASHPTTAALAVMGITVLGQLINGNPQPTDRRRWEIRGQLAGLYDGAQKLGAAAAIAPVAVGAMGVLEAAVTARGAKK